MSTDHPFTLHALDHVAITVEDIDRAVAWYTGVLGLEHRGAGGVPTFVCAGDSCVAIFPGEPTPGEGFRHFAFRTDRDGFERAQETFRRDSIPFEFADHGICHSAYVSDPDGYRVEVTTYEV